MSTRPVLTMVHCSAEILAMREAGKAAGVNNGDKLPRRYLISPAKGAAMLSLARLRTPIPRAEPLRALAPRWGSWRCDRPRSSSASRFTAGETAP